jgi:hypothetical protein
LEEQSFLQRIDLASPKKPNRNELAKPNRVAVVWPALQAKEALVKSKCSHLFNLFFLFFSMLQGEAHCSASHRVVECEAEHHFSATRRRRKSGGQSPMLRFDLIWRSHPLRGEAKLLRTAERFGFANLRCGAKEVNPHHGAMRCIDLVSPKEAWNKI